MAADYAPGDYVSTPAYGPARVRGVETDPLAGQCLTLALLAHPGAIVRVPVSKVAGARLRVVSATDAETMAATWAPPRGKWNHIPRDVQRARRVAELRKKTG